MERVVVEWITAYASLFVHNWNHYAVQQRDGAYWRMTEPLTLASARSASRRAGFAGNVLVG